MLRALEPLPESIGTPDGLLLLDLELCMLIEELLRAVAVTILLSML
jgi:hypothetical protein